MQCSRRLELQRLITWELYQRHLRLCASTRTDRQSSLLLKPPRACALSARPSHLVLAILHRQLMAAL